MTEDHTSKPRKPSRKSTNAEIEERITAAEILICRCARRGEIHAHFAAKYDVCWRSTDRYVARARERLRQRSTRPRQDHFDESMTFYESVIRDKNARPQDKLRARQRMDELLGLDAPKRQEVAGPGGGPIQQEVLPILPATVTESELRAIISLADAVEAGATLPVNGEARPALN